MGERRERGGGGEWGSEAWCSAGRHSMRAHKEGNTPLFGGAWRGRKGKAREEELRSNPADPTQPKGGERSWQRDNLLASGFVSQIHA